MTRVRRDTHLPYYTENPRKNLHLLGKLTFPSNAGALLGKVVILWKFFSSVVQNEFRLYKLLNTEKMSRQLKISQAKGTSQLVIDKHRNNNKGAIFIQNIVVTIDNKSIILSSSFFSLCLPYGRW